MRRARWCRIIPPQHVQRRHVGLAAAPSPWRLTTIVGAGPGGGAWRRRAAAAAAAAARRRAAGGAGCRERGAARGRRAGARAWEESASAKVLMSETWRGQAGLSSGPAGAVPAPAPGRTAIRRRRWCGREMDGSKIYFGCKIDLPRRGKGRTRPPRMRSTSSSSSADIRACPPARPARVRRRRVGREGTVLAALTKLSLSRRRTKLPRRRGRDIARTQRRGGGGGAPGGRRDPGCARRERRKARAAGIERSTRSNICARAVRVAPETVAGEGRRCCWGEGGAGGGGGG